MTRGGKAVLISIAGLVLWAMAAPDVLGAAFPGTNGRIAYAGGGELYSMNADATDVVNLTNNAAPDYNAMWSADGSRIAFDRGHDGNFESYKMNADGSGQTRLTDDAINGTGDDWSPNTYTPAGGLSRSAHKRITLRLG